MEQRVTNLSITNQNLCQGTREAEERGCVCCSGWVTTDCPQCLEDRAKTQVSGSFFKFNNVEGLQGQFGGKFNVQLHPSLHSWVCICCLY